MKSIISATILLLGASAVSADPVAPPKPEDQALVEIGLADLMRDPQSMVLTDVLAADDPTSESSITWICGVVRGKNALGGYADPKPFVAMVTNDPLSGSRGLNLLRVAENSDQEAVAMQICTSKFEFAKAASEASEDVRLSLLKQSALELECLIGGTDAPSCDERVSLLKDLEAAGFCVGDDGLWGGCPSR